jgi:serine/threonine protein kinase
MLKKILHLNTLTLSKIYSFFLMDCVDSSYLFILEYADSGTLKNYLEINFNKLDWNKKLKFAIHIADAVSCIHQKGFIHNDLVQYFIIYFNY